MLAYVRFPAVQLPHAVGRDDADGRRKSDGRPGHLCHGPYITLGPGRYTAGFYLQRGAAGDDDGEIVIDACNAQGQQIFAKQTTPVKELFSSVAGLQHVDFTIDVVERGCELRLWVPARTHVEVSEAVLFRTDIDNWGRR
ncbi:MAG: hypothetical protein KGM15_06000 [Pseudomonadota bacterium]|nr:hypothetical protein [Pseudomonadota bacterium]